MIFEKRGEMLLMSPFIRNWLNHELLEFKEFDLIKRQKSTGRYELPYLTQG